MKTSSTLRLSLLTPLILAIAACGGGAGGGGGGGDYANVSPIKGVSISDIENRTGIKNRQAQKFDSSAAIMTTAGGNSVKGFADAQIMFHDSQQNNDGSTRDAGVMVRVDVNGDGIYDGVEDQYYDMNYNPNGNPISATTGEPIAQVQTMSYGGSQLVRAENIPDYNQRYTVYVPADAASNMHGGMAVYSVDGGPAGSDAVGAVGIFGRSISAAELGTLDAQYGKASYQGVAEAIVSGAMGNESGRYRDNGAVGSIDFQNNVITTTAANMVGLNNPSSNIAVTTNTTYNASTGAVNTGSATITGLSTGTISGSVNGEIYGSNAETLGVVFSGNEDTATVVGGMLLNRTDD